MQDVIGGGAQQQGETVAAVAADDDEVTALFLGESVDFLARLAIGQVALFGEQFRVEAGEAIQAFPGLFELLLLEHREVHGDVTAKGHGHGFDDMHQRQLGLGRQGESLGAAHHRVALVGEVDGDQNVLVGHG